MQRQTQRPVHISDGSLPTRIRRCNCTTFCGVAISRRDLPCSDWRSFPLARSPHLTPGRPRRWPAPRASRAVVGDSWQLRSRGTAPQKFPTPWRESRRLLLSCPSPASRLTSGSKNCSRASANNGTLEARVGNADRVERDIDTAGFVDFITSSWGGPSDVLSRVDDGPREQESTSCRRTDPTHTASGCEPSAQG